MVTRSKGGGRIREQWLNGYRVSLWDDENILELDRGVVLVHCECAKSTELFILKWLILFYVHFVSKKREQLMTRNK